MYIVWLLITVAVVTSSSADRCGMTDFLEQLIESVKTVQRNGQSCGATTDPRVGKAGPQGAPGPIGPPGIVDMAAIEQRIREMVDESRDSLMRLGEMCYLGLKSRQIPDTSITASAYWGPRHEPYRARMDDQIAADSIGAWAAKRNSIGEWLQIDIGRVKEVAGIITQGRRGSGQRVTSYKVSCGANSRQLSVVRSNGREKVFDGNSDMDTKIYNRFPEVLSCRYVRIYPQSWNGHMSMRVELVSGACFNYTVPW